MILRKNEFLRLLSDQPLLLDPTDGTETLAQATDVFGYIDPDFRNWDLNYPSPNTPATPVRVWEQIQDGTFRNLFDSLRVDRNRLCLTQAQIKGFVKKHRQWLRIEGYSTSFLFKKEKKEKEEEEKKGSSFFVAFVYVGSGGRLAVHVYRLEYSYVWPAEYRHRLVASQLA